MRRFSFHTVLGLLCAAVCAVSVFGGCPPARAALPALTVVSAMPEGPVTDLAQITVRFSAAMHPLGVMEETREASPLKLSVTTGALPPGDFRWLDPFTLAYLFDAPVRRPLGIRASVPEGTRSLAGNVLETGVAWTITTPRLALRLTNAENRPLGRDGAVLTLRANYPLDAGRLRKKSGLTVNGKPLAFTLTELKTRESHEGRPSAWEFSYAVKRPLPKNSTVVLTVAAGLTAEDGGDPAEQFVFSLPTYGDLDLREWHIDSYPVSSEKKPRPEYRLTVRFNNPVRLGDLLGRISVSPAPGMPGPGEISRNAVSTEHSLPFLWEPRTAYTVTIRPGLKDRYGTTLAKQRVMTFTTGDYMPLLAIPGGRAVLERDLAHRFPLTMRNAGTVTARLRYLPWGPAAFRLLLSGDVAAGAAFLKNPGARETRVALDTSGKPNVTLREWLNIPAALGFGSAPGSAGNAQGLMTVRLLPPDRDAKETGDSAKLYANRTYEAILQATDLGILVRLGDSGGLGWVAAISSGKPVPGAGFSLLDKDGNRLWSGNTGADGVAALPGLASLPDMPRFCLVKTDTDTAVLDLAAARLPDDANAYAAQKKANAVWAIHAIPQLPLYRPGQTVNALVYARRHTDALNGKKLDFPDWRPVAGEILRLSVTDRNGREIHSLEAAANAYGSIPLSFTLPENAEPGWYFVRAKSDTAEREAVARPFQVASFRPPEFKVDLTPPPEQPVPVSGDLAAGVRAGYFSGSALDGGDVSLRVETSRSRFAPPRLAGYRTGPDDAFFGPRGGPGRELAGTVTGTLDEAGNAVLRLPRLRPDPRPRNVFLNATVTDASGLTSQGTASVLLHPSEYYIGLRAPFYAARGKDAALMLKAASWDDKPLKGLTVVLKAARLTYDADGNPKTEPVWEKQVTLLDETGDRVSVSFDKSGSYRLTAGVTDPSGRRNEAVAVVYVPGSGMGWANAHQPGRLELLAEEKTYAPGETARIALKTTLDDAVVLVSIERNGVRRASVHTVTGEDPVIAIPLEEADAPFVHASVTLIRGRTAPPPGLTERSPGGNGSSGGKDRHPEYDGRVPDLGAPVLMQAGLTLRVSGTEAGLSVGVTTDAEKYRPGGEVAVSVTVRDGSGNGRKAQVTLLAVDERVLRAAGGQTAFDPRQTFMPRYFSRMYSADLWQYLLKRDLTLLGPDRPRVRLAMNAPEAMGPAAAGPADERKDGGPADIALRRDFTPAVFWLAQGETGADGTLSASFTLPDSLTGYRIVAVAADRDRGFGLGQTSVSASKPLQLLSALPKFVTGGDRIDAGVLVRNTGGTREQISVTAGVFGAEAGELSRSVTLDAGQSGLVSFPLRVDAPSGGSGELRIRVAGRMGDETDGAEFTLPVKPARPVTTVAAAGVLRETERFVLPVRVPAGIGPSGSLEVVFAASPAAGVIPAAGEVIRYPWNCLEQRLSRAWARLIRLEHGGLLGLLPDPGDREAIAGELAVIPTFQHSDGSFGFWPGFRDGDAGGAGLFLTAYALFVSKEGERQGLNLPESVTRRAAGFVARTLDAALPGNGSAAARGRSLSIAPDAAAFALRALALYDREHAARLFPAVLGLCADAETGPFGWGFLLLALDAVPPQADGRDVIGGIVSALEKTAAVTPAHLHFGAARDTGSWRTLGSSLRDNAAVLAALAAAKPDYPRLEALAAWVGQRIGDTGTLSTQEGVFGVWGLVRYLLTLDSGRETVARAVWNGRDEVSLSFSGLAAPPSSWTLPASALNSGGDSSLSLEAVSGNPHWIARLRYTSPGPATEERNAGFSITRTLDSSGPWQVGDLVDVTLTVTVPATRRHVLLVDPFPAGFEPLHATRVDLTAREEAFSRQNSWQWRDVLDDGMLLYAPVLRPGTYTYTHTLRAVASGTFTQRASFVEEMYAPEVSGGTAGGAVEVTAKGAPPLPL